MCSLDHNLHIRNFLSVPHGQIASKRSSIQKYLCYIRDATNIPPLFQPCSPESRSALEYDEHSCDFTYVPARQISFELFRFFKYLLHIHNIRDVPTGDISIKATRPLKIKNPAYVHHFADIPVKNLSMLLLYFTAVDIIMNPIFHGLIEHFISSGKCRISKHRPTLNALPKASRSFCGQFIFDLDFALPTSQLEPRQIHVPARNINVFCFRFRLSSIHSFPSCFSYPLVNFV